MADHLGHDLAQVLLGCQPIIVTPEESHLLVNQNFPVFLGQSPLCWLCSGHIVEVLLSHDVLYSSPSCPSRTHWKYLWKSCYAVFRDKLTVLHALRILENCVGGCARSILTRHDRQHRPVHLGPDVQSIGCEENGPREFTHRSQQRGRRHSCRWVE